MNKQLEDRSSKLFDDLVPASGKAGTLEGEMLRAINRIVYRDFNDGDVWYEGYGCETCGPCVTFLLEKSPIDTKIEKSENLTGERYTKAIYESLEIILEYIESVEDSTKIDCDMWDFDPPYEVEEECCSWCGEEDEDCTCD